MEGEDAATGAMLTPGGAARRRRIRCRDQDTNKKTVAMNGRAVEVNEMYGGSGRGNEGRK